MTWVKICGMTNLEDALVAVDAGADAVGFVFYEKSPRCVSVETAREIVARLPGSVEKVGVFVAAAAEEVKEASARAKLTIAQVYVNPPSESSRLDDTFLTKVPCPVIAAVSAGLVGKDEIAGFHISNQNRDRIMGVLLDSGSSDRPGGTGRAFEWENTKPIAELAGRIGLKLVVAGGLTSQNVGEAMGILKPWGVDVSSGVEARPGKKDPEKVRAFVQTVREMDRKAG